LTSKDCPKPTRLLGNSGATAPMGPQFVVSCWEMEDTYDASAAPKRSAMLLPSSGWMLPSVSLSLKALVSISSAIESKIETHPTAGSQL
jgi:hypothetical protein